MAGMAAIPAGEIPVVAAGAIDLNSLNNPLTALRLGGLFLPV
jgi:hypothetical protein